MRRTDQERQDRHARLGPGLYCRNSVEGEWNYMIEAESTAENIDWERWLGPVKKRVPFSAEHFHRWRKYYPYCSGPAGRPGAAPAAPADARLRQPGIPDPRQFHRHQERA